MDLYPLLVFLHVAGGTGIFVAMGVEAVALRWMRRAGTLASARAAVDLTTAGGLGHVSMLTALVAGIWMMVVRWGPEPWIGTAIVAVVGMAVVGAAFTLRPVRRIRLALADPSLAELTDAHRLLLARRVLRRSLMVRLAIGVGIVGLMTAKPDLAGSIAIMSAATLIGLAASLLGGGWLSRRSPVRTGTGATDAA